MSQVFGDPKRLVNDYMAGSHAIGIRPAPRRVQFDFKDRFEYYDAASRRAKEKRQLVNFVKSRLGMRSRVPLLSDSQSFRQWDTPSLFTVRRGEW